MTDTPAKDFLRAGVMIGIGLAGTLDEVALHQLLHWHHFYDRSTTAVGLVSDGIFHVVSTAFLVLGAYWIHRRGAPLSHQARRKVWSGVFLGAGSFNFYDGTIQHKVLKLHQVRPGPRNQLPYDVGFIGLSVVLIAIGAFLLRRHEA